MRSDAEDPQVQASPAARPLVACEMCAALFQRPLLQRDEAASCTRCGTLLWRHSRLTPSAWLALAIAALFVFLTANAFPIADMSVQGMRQSTSLPGALVANWRQGQFMVALMCGGMAFFLPLLQLLTLLWVLLPLSRGALAPGFAPALRLLGLLRPWSMVPVFLLGVLVAVVKLADMASVAPGIGLAGFAALTVLLTILGRLSPAALWRLAEQAGLAQAGQARKTPDTVLAGCHVCGQVQPLPRATLDAPHHCQRCHARLHYRKPDHVARTWALLLAAGILYIPANLLPVMEVSSLLGASAHTILGGVIELWALGSWDLAIIVFIASVMVPMAKLLALSVLLFTAQRASPHNLRPRTRLYQAVEIIGQWSMLDVFVVILLAALAHFQGLMEITAGAGAAAFGMVVVLTILAASSFDPRRLWDQARDGAPLDTDSSDS